MSNNVVYTDACSTDNITAIVNAGINLLQRPDKWSISEIAYIFTNPALRLVIINSLNELSIMEIGLAAFLCKDILITSEAYIEFNGILNIVTHIDTTCNLTKPCNFISWYNYTYGK